MILDAQLYATAARIRALLPQWFIDLGETHAAEVERLHNAGHTVAAALLAAHAPMLEDGGVGCLDPHADAEGYEDPQPYPCALARSLWPALRYLA